MKILFLPRWYPSKKDPMMGLFIKRHAEVASSFADVFVLVVIADHTCFETEIVTTGKVVTLYYYYPSSKTSYQFINSIINQLSWIYYLTKGLLQLKRKYCSMDLIHVNILTRLGIIAWIVKQLWGIPYVVTEHWSRYINGSFNGALRIWFTRLVIGGAAKVSTVTLNLWESMQRYGLTNPNYMRLSNVVDTSLFKPSVLGFESSVFLEKTLNQLYIDQQCYNPRRFIHVSCFEDRSKNISGLLRVLANLSNTTTNFECLFVGEGIDFEMLKLYADRLGLKHPQVQFTGLLEGSKLVEAYCSASFMVLFSNYENMPVVIGEAFACGLPVITTRTGGIAEYMTDWNGQMISIGDEAALSSSILHFLFHADEFDRQHIRSYAEQCFGTATVEKQLKALYNIHSVNDVVS